MLLILVCGSNITISQSIYWEHLTDTEQNEFLKNTSVSTIAIDYFKGKFKASDDSLTFELLDTITNNKEYNPLYFYIFNEISMGADGALAEVIPTYCYQLFVKYPKEVIGYFTIERLQYADFLRSNRYAKILGWGFKNYGFVGEESKSNYKDFKNFLMSQLADVNNEDQKSLKTFFKEIEKIIEKQ
jgi:hypothetical protein